MKVAIYGRVFKKENAQFIQQLYDNLLQKDIDFITEEVFLAQCVASGIKPRQTSTFSNQKELLSQEIDFMIVLGGDGTILDTIVYMYKKPIPVLGINTGRLGFLAGESKNDISKALDNLIKGHFSIDYRSVLQLETSTPLFEGVTYAINDFVIHKKDSSSMITIHTYVNGEYLNSYWSDGLIISTPTGSTGYSLSCGGPILYPSSNSVVITPIAPHNLNVRPIVISDENIISFEIEGRSTGFLITLDARSESISSSVQLAVKKAGIKFPLIRFNEENYLNTLRRKLMWGHDNRNK
jgi:NAD+ kinase